MARPRHRDIFVRELRALGGRAANGQLQGVLGWPKDKYWDVHAQLYGEGQIEKGRGYGGTVILIESAADHDPPDEIAPFDSNAPQTTATLDRSTPVESSPVVVAPTEEIPLRELDLYDPVRRQLEQNWAQRRQLDHCHCEITAMQGRRETGGSWSRPDLALIAYRKYEFLPEKVFELFSFEVKPANDVSIKGVMEALAHREAATRSFVIYHTAGEDFTDFAEAARIEELATKHGVGVYAARDINDFNQWAEVVPAQRATPDPEAVDTFIRRTLSDEAKTKLRKWF